MSQDYNKSRRTARARRNRPVLVTEQELAPQRAVESATIATEHVKNAPAEVAETAKPRRRLASFFSTVGRNDAPTENKETDVARARLARATRNKVAEDKGSATTKENTETTASTETKPASKAAPQRPPSAFKTRYIFGMFIYLIAANFIGVFETTALKNAGLDKPLFSLFNFPVSLSTLAFLATLVLILIVLAKLDFLPTSLMGGRQHNRAMQGQSQSSSNHYSSKAPQPTARQGVKGSDDALYQQYRQSQRKKK
jgi:hypothetical protein